jgi:hypothetical protein
MNATTQMSRKGCYSLDHLVERDEDAGDRSTMVVKASSPHHPYQLLLKFLLFSLALQALDAAQIIDNVPRFAKINFLQQIAKFELHFLNHASCIRDMRSSVHEGGVMLTLRQRPWA